MTKRKGRKRKAGAARRPGGRIDYGTHKERAEDMQRIVKEARERVFGLSKQAAAAMPETTVLGRLVVTGEISRRQYEAAARYAEIVREHDILLGAKGFPKAGNLERTAGHDGDEGTSAAYQARYRHAMARYDSCRAALRDAAREDRMAGSVVDAVAVNNWALPDLTPSLRIGLNHLARVLDGAGGGAAGRTQVAGAKAADQPGGDAA